MPRFPGLAEHPVPADFGSNSPLHAPAPERTTPRTTEPRTTEPRTSPSRAARPGATARRSEMTQLRRTRDEREIERAQQAGRG